MADSTVTTESIETTAPNLQQKLTAEAIGTLVLVLFGCGSVIYAAQVDAPSTLASIGLTFGIVIMVMVYAFGRISGGHFNPAVSIGAAIGGRVPWRDAWLYMVAQVVGAILGGLVLFVLMHGFKSWDSEGNMGQNVFGDQSAGDYAWWAAFLLELATTAVFVFVILSVTDTRNEHPALAPLAIGFTLASIHFMTIPATGTSVNPARSIGPALFAGGDSIAQLWLFILAPLAGGLLAGIVYPMLFGRAAEDVPGSGLNFSRPPRPATQAPAYATPDQYQQQWGQEPIAAHSAEPAPIIQDGWQWDPVGQQWHPVGQTPEQWRAQQAAQEQAQQQAQQHAQQQPQQPAPQDPGQYGQYGQPQPGQQGQQPGSSDPDGGTQIRPPGQ